MFEVFAYGLAEQNEWQKIGLVGWMDGQIDILIDDGQKTNKMDRYFVVCLSLTLSITDNVTALQLIQGKSKTGPHLRSMSY